MLSILQAKKIGINACIDKIGRDLCVKYADQSASSYGQNGDVVNCFVGLSTTPFHPENIDKLVLTEEKEWDYSAECSVDLSSGEIIFYN